MTIEELKKQNLSRWILQHCCAIIELCGDRQTGFPLEVLEELDGKLEDLRTLAETHKEFIWEDIDEVIEVKNKSE